MEIKAPDRYTSSPHPWIFLSGSIAMGKAVDWQEEVAVSLSEYTVLNPRRDDWDSTWEQSIHDTRFREQVQWELRALVDCDLVLVYFAPETYAPITLLELGLVVGMGENRVIVCCPPSFYRKGNVEILCALNGIPLVDSLGELISSAQKYLDGE